MSGRYLEQGMNIRFCVKLGQNANDTCAMLSEAYGEEAMQNSSVFEWHKLFKEGRRTWKMITSRRQRCHRTEENVEKKVRNLVH